MQAPGSAMPRRKPSTKGCRVMRNSELMAIKSLQSFPGAPGSGRAGLNTDTGLIKGSQLGELQPDLGHFQRLGMQSFPGHPVPGQAVPPAHTSHSCSWWNWGCSMHKVEQSWSNPGMQHSYKPCEKCKVVCECFWA